MMAVVILFNTTAIRYHRLQKKKNAKKNKK